MLKRLNLVRILYMLYHTFHGFSDFHRRLGVHDGEIILIANPHKGAAKYSAVSGSKHQGFIVFEQLSCIDTRLLFTHIKTHIGFRNRFSTKVSVKNRRRALGSLLRRIQKGFHNFVGFRVFIAIHFYA